MVRNGNAQCGSKKSYERRVLVSDKEDNFITPIAQAAMALHELYVELLRAGFTRRDALDLVGKMLLSSLQQSDGE